MNPNLINLEIDGFIAQNLKYKHKDSEIFGLSYFLGKPDVNFDSQIVWMHFDDSCYSQYKRSGVREYLLQGLLVPPDGSYVPGRFLFRATNQKFQYCFAQGNFLLHRDPFELMFEWRKGFCSLFKTFEEYENFAIDQVIAGGNRFIKPKQVEEIFKIGERINAST